MPCPYGRTRLRPKGRLLEPPYGGRNSKAEDCDEFADHIGGFIEGGLFVGRELDFDDLLDAFARQVLQARPRNGP